MTSEANRSEASASTDSLSDADLLAALECRYAPSVIPPCRVCGTPLGIGRIGGGEPTVWACQNAKHTNGQMDWGHYDKSQHIDYRQGGDNNVIELIRRYRALATPGRLKPKKPITCSACYTVTYATKSGLYYRHRMPQKAFNYSLPLPAGPVCKLSGKPIPQRGDP